MRKNLGGDSLQLVGPRHGRRSALSDMKAVMFLQFNIASKPSLAAFFKLAFIWSEGVLFFFLTCGAQGRQSPRNSWNIVDTCCADFLASPRCELFPRCESYPALSD
jgi:hypothetical protein